MTFPRDPNGEIDDRVGLSLAGDEVRIFEEYNVHTAILQQPAAFSTRLSAGKRLARELIASYPPGPKTPFTLTIGPYRQFTGEIDAIDVAGATGSTSVSFRGRDMLARLHDADIEAEKTFENLSHADLLREALKDVGLGDRRVEISNDANVNVRTGTRVKIIAPPVTPSEIRRVKTGAGEKIVVTAKLGESWLTFLQRHFEKLGLFCWADAEGHFVLSRPNKFQQPLYTFVRQRGQRANVCNVVDAHFSNDTSKRFSEVVIFARSGGKKHGRNHIHDGFVDQEMVDLGFKRRRVYRDANVNDAREASAYAARKLGEINRASWRLVYTVSGHTAPAIDGGRAVIVPDTMAQIEDDELGINEPLYVESCEYRSPPRTTTITFMRPRDIVFGDFD